MPAQTGACFHRRVLRPIPADRTRPTRACHRPTWHSQSPHTAPTDCAHSRGQARTDRSAPALLLGSMFRRGVGRKPYYTIQARASGVGRTPTRTADGAVGACQASTIGALDDARPSRPNRRTGSTKPSSRRLPGRCLPLHRLSPPVSTCWHARCVTERIGRHQEARLPRRMETRHETAN